MVVLPSGMGRARQGARRISRVALSLMLVASLRWPDGAEPVQPAWTSIGPEGGSITVIAVDPLNSNTLYAGTQGGGVFKTTDGGRSWHANNIGLQENPLGDMVVTALALDPRTPSTLYVGTDSGVFKSTDEGRTWHASALDGDATALVIDPHDPATLYAGTRAGLYKSTDGGGSWRGVNSGVPTLLLPRFGGSAPLYPRINALAVDPRTPTTLYAGVSEGRSIFKSTDGGESWRDINNGLDGAGSGCCPLIIDPQTPIILYTGTENGGVFQSVDGGETWHPINDGLIGLHVTALEAAPLTPTTLYTCVAHTSTSSSCSLFKSADSGGTWRPLNVGNSRFNLAALIVDPRNPRIMYAGTRTGVFKSTDGGGRWVASNTGLANFDISVIVDSKKPTTLYGLSDRGLFKSTNGGRTWRILDVDQAGQFLSALAIDPQNPTTLYLGTAATFDEAGRGVFKSTDGGQSWRAVTAGLTNLSLSVSVMTIDPRTPTTVYAASYRRLGQVPESDAGLLKSTDGGETWRSTRIGSGDLYIAALVIDPQIPTTLYAAVRAGPPFKSTDGVFKSVNGGETWRAVNTGLPPNNGLPQVYLSSLAIDPHRPTNVYAGSLSGPGTGGGVYKSTDGGISWSAVGTGLLGGVEALAIDPRTPTIIYAGTTRGGVFKSTDSGRTWRAINEGLANLRVTVLVIDPNDPFTIYASTEGNGVFVLRQ